MTDDTDPTRIRPRALVVSYGGRDYVVPPDFHGLFAIGRGASCQITVDSKIVSRLHGCIRVTNGLYSYRDTSSNGTIVMTGHDETLVQEAEIELPEAGALKVGDVLLHFACRHG
jgi:pSer/pThr/pTyr-binding forkhead associated (FHA) protein